MSLAWKNTDFECGSVRYFERIRDMLGYDTTDIPFSRHDTTAGAENELQAVVIGSREAGSTYFDVNRDGDFDHGVDYAHVKNNGIGRLPSVWYHSTNHTNSLVPLYAKGAGSELFKAPGLIAGIEPNLRAIYNLNKAWTGEYIDNTSIYQVMYKASVQ